MKYGRSKSRKGKQELSYGGWYLLLLYSRLGI